jgi:hypothetical protein
MRKYLLLLLILQLLFSCIFKNSNSQHYYQVNKSDYQGIVFSGKNVSYNIFESHNDFFYPKIEQISIAEKLIKMNIGKMNIDKLNQYDNCPVIHKNLKKYARQYIGFINEKGEKVVWINFIWKKYNSHITDMMDKEIIYFHDGCSYFWNIKVNIDKNQVYDLKINGKS